MQGEMRDGEPPEGLPAKEIVVLHDREGEKSLVILFSIRRTITGAATRCSMPCRLPIPRGSAHP
jgi:hypothetical protein